MSLPEVIKGVEGVRPIDFNIDVLDDVAHAYARAWVRLSFHKLDQAVEGEVRQSFFLRKTKSGWRIFHYHESRLTPGFEGLVDN
jgi:hypothetical protein